MAEASRKGVFRIHAWIGLNLGFLLFVVCFSGTVAVFSAELNWLVDPALRVEAPDTAERESVSWQEMHDRVARAYPDALILYLIAPRGERSVARAAIALAPGDIRRVLINPYTGDLQGLRSGFNLVSFFRIFHKQLYIVPSILWIHGTLIVGVLAVALLAGAITGLLSIKRWRRAFLTLRRSRSRRLFWSDLHRLTGVWALLVTIVLSLTGIWYLAERILLDVGALAEDARPARLDADDLRHRAALLTPLDLDKGAALAKAAIPSLAIARIALPMRPGDPLIFAGQADAWLVRDRANHVQMDPYTGEILDIRRAVDLGPFERWVETADPLHFGTFAGTVSQIMWFIAGLLICGGILAGLYGSWLRRRQRGDPSPRNRFAAATATVPTLALVAASVYGTWVYGGETLTSAQRSIGITPLMQGKLGPWKVSIVQLHPTSDSPGLLDVSIRFDHQGQPNFERAELWIGDTEKLAKARHIKRLVDRLLGQVVCPGDDRLGECQLNLRITEWNGVQHSVSVDLTSHFTFAARSDLPVASVMSVGEVIVVIAFVLCTLFPLLGWIRLQFL